MSGNVPVAAMKLLDFISTVEAPQGYDTVFGNNQSRMPTPITKMTIAAVIKDGRRRTRAYGSSAAGRYQFMPPTLQGLVKEGAAPATALMTPAVQDQLAYALLKRRGFEKYMDGRMSVTAFGKALAQEWASFPVLAATTGAHRQVARGETYYADDGINKVGLKPAAVERVLLSLKIEHADDIAPALVRKPVAADPATDDDAGPSAAPEARQVPLPPKVVAAPWWARLWPGKASPAIPVVSRPGLAVNGDTALWDIQSKLKRFGYEPILVDGLNGPRTRAQVRVARERMGLPAGDHIDTAFTASLAGLLPAEVAEIRVTATNREIVKEQAPDLFAPLKGIRDAGIGSLILGGLGGASDSGLMDSIRTTADSVTTTAGTIQEALAVAFNIGRWCYAHWWIFALGGGLYLIAKAVIGTLKLVALWRQARAS